ncbi:hypothetical protein SAMN05421636_1174 [Pricia antarctica]|uniref:Uncharacterized protein n=1 Tax=Pricia antarctica TaxID=641691 RepID=A0A1G7J1V1_9FLAO|nr:hypothetical protein [Pricia antarctica]SDF18838.1 hypothetical protein SAMN05421636_1174 [Pricia antarctica]
MSESLCKFIRENMLFDKPFAKEKLSETEDLMEKIAMRRPGENPNGLSISTKIL